MSIRRGIILVSLHALAVIGVLFFLFSMSLAKHPFWGMLGYVFLYYNTPSPEINWWAYSLPQIRWSFIAAVLILVSLFLHAQDVNKFRINEMLNLRWFIALAVVMISLLPVAVNAQVAPRKTYEFVRYLIIFFFLVKSVQDMKHFELLVWFLLLCSLNLSWEAYTHAEYRSAGRLEGIGTSDSTDSNMFASVLVACVPFLIREVLVENWKRKVAVAGISVFVFNAIVLCNSRGAMLALVVVGIAIFLLEGDRKSKMKMAVILVLGLIMFISLMDPAALQRMQTIVGEGDTTGSGRTEIWGYGLSMSRQNPLGVGGDGFKYLSPQYMPQSLLTGGQRSPHNTYLKVLVEQGWLGLVLYLCAWGSTFRFLHMLRKKIKDSSSELKSELIKISQYSLSVEAAIIGVMVSGFFVDRLYFELSYILAAMATFLYLYGSKILNENRVEGSEGCQVTQNNELV